MNKHALNIFNLAIALVLIADHFESGHFTF
jgi:hypothetical protein